MPISVLHDYNQQRVTAIATGTLTFAELADFFLAQQRGDRQLWPVLLDATTAKTSMSVFDAERLAAELMTVIGDSERHGPIAIIALDDTLFGLVRIWQMFCERQGINLRACRLLKTAERWLDLIVLEQYDPIEQAGPLKFHS